MHVKYSEIKSMFQQSESPQGRQEAVTSDEAADTIGVAATCSREQKGVGSTLISSHLNYGGGGHGGGGYGGGGHGGGGYGGVGGTSSNNSILLALKVEVMVAEEDMEAVDTGMEAAAEEDMEEVDMAMGSNGVQECFSKCCKLSPIPLTPIN
ncbi:class E basic helix-loop-helix protein 22-like [Penaeus monodon]|uniref:class E basic helix-loop-helix protein 22-like n=1 Tax=Penaeus monodon TaxID=6687 RepID=UPI0018A79F6E|nr:class E basic helix-loop-helix protein 22-like [Penaeus monodon]